MPCAERLEMLAFGSCLCYTAKNTGTAPCSFAVAIYPREGTETHATDVGDGGDGCNLSPRGDGNLAAKLSRSHHRGCNLSPRGDGNVWPRPLPPLDMVAIYPREGTETHPYPKMQFVPKLQFIPARGRKLSDDQVRVRAPKVAIYPREGTETSSMLRL